MTTHNKFVQWLETMLLTEGWSQTELAERSGVTRTHISRILSGDRRPGLEFYEGVARAFRVPLEEVLRYAGVLPVLPDADPSTSGLLARLSELPPLLRQATLSVFYDVLALLLHSPDQTQSSSSVAPLAQTQNLDEADLVAWLEALPDDKRRRVREAVEITFGEASLAPASVRSNARR